MIRVLICDDQEVVRRGLAVILQHSPGLDIVGLAADGHEAVALAAALKPDVVLMDLKMPRLNGIQATRRIVELRPAPRVLVLTTFDADEWVFDAIRAGALGYLLKDAEGEAIVAAIQDTAAGRSRLDPQIAGKILQEFNRLARAPVRPGPEAPALEDLTERELSVLRLMVQGQSNRTIAATLHLAPGTVKNHVSSILAKLHSNDRTQAVLAALRRGIVPLDQPPSDPD